MPTVLLAARSTSCHGPGDDQAGSQPVAFRIRRRPGAPVTARRTSACRKKSASCPLAGAYQLFDFALDQVTLERAHVADKEPAVQMVGFMQESAGEQVVTGLFKPVPFHILSADG